MSDLIQQMREAAKRPMTRLERDAQTVSWAYGSMSWDSSLTRDEVQAMLDHVISDTPLKGR